MGLANATHLQIPTAYPIGAGWTVLGRTRVARAQPPEGAHTWETEWSSEGQGRVMGGKHPTASTQHSARLSLPSFPEELLGDC